MDAFFASAEQLTRPTLRGRPVLVGGVGGRGVVAGASYQARQCGARSAMPMHQAVRLVGAAAVVLPPRFVVYSALSSIVFDTVRNLIPVIEQLSLDEAFGEPADLVDATAEQVEQFCAHLRAAVLAASGLVASVGAGSGKQIAKIASGLAKPDGITVVAPDSQPELLASLPVRKLWGIGPVAEERLRRLGVLTVGALAAMPESEVASVLGTAVGPALRRLACGSDDRPVHERAESKQISAETTLDIDIRTRPELVAVIGVVAESAHRRLLADGRGARTVVLKLRRTDMSITTRSMTLPHATVDLDTITATAERAAPDPVEFGAVRLVGVGLGGLSSVRQESLFPELDRIREPLDAADLDHAGPVSDRAVPDPAPHNFEQMGPVRWRAGLDVQHAEFGHGWVQGAGHEVVTVRFETCSTGPGVARTFAYDDPSLSLADPLAALD